jgi:hypothetical protein
MKESIVRNALFKYGVLGLQAVAGGSIRSWAGCRVKSDEADYGDGHQSGAFVSCPFASGLAVRQGSVSVFSRRAMPPSVTLL